MKKIYLIFAFLGLLTACNEDLGNYDYDNINTVMIGLDPVISVRLENRVLTLAPELYQSLSENYDNLEFMWLYSITNENFYGHGKYDTIGDREKLDFTITEDMTDYEHFFRLNVYDRQTGITYPANTKLILVKPYTGAWMVLHEENGAARLGAVEYIGEYVVTPDAYFKESGNQFTGRPVTMYGSDRQSYQPYGAGSYLNLFGVFTDNPAESGILCQWNKFKNMQTFYNMVAPVYRSEFDFSNFFFAHGDGSDYGWNCISGGVPYNSTTGMKIYKDNVSGDITGDIHITHSAKIGIQSILYDAAGKRFLHFLSGRVSGQYNVAIFDESSDNPANVMLKYIPTREGLNNTDANPNNIDPTHQVLYTGTGFKYDDGNNSTYGYALARKDARDSYVYVFNSYGLSYADRSSFADFHRIDTPQGLDENCVFASGEFYNGFIFYASGNVVYRLDFMQSGGKATPIYTHTAGGTASAMRLAKEKQGFTVDFSGYQFDPLKSLGVAFNMPDGTGELVILNLSATGLVGSDSEDYEATQIHSGFGPITDIIFI